MAAVVGNLFKMANRIVCQPIVQGSVTAVATATRNFGVSSILQNVRCHFPRPSEIKRIKRHGLKARLSTFNGRKIIMNRILKGRHVLAH